MRLISVSVSGIGRLVDATMNVDNKVIAVVGPNEAGKTTLLRALSFLTSGGRIPTSERSRAGRSVEDDQTLVRARFAVEESDLLSFRDVPLQQQPTHVTLSRHADGDHSYVSVEPYPQRPLAKLRDNVEALTAVLTEEQALRDRVDTDSAWSVDQPGGGRDFIAELGALVQAARKALDTKTPLALDSSNTPDLAQELAGALKSEDDETTAAIIQELLSLQSWARSTNPEPAVRTALFAALPKFLLFDEDERTLNSSYTIDEAFVATPPAAIRNLAQVGELNLRALLSSLNEGDISRRETDLRRANKTLAQFFSKIWTQSKVSVELRVDGSQLLVNVLQDDDVVTPFQERSAGMRAFAALVCFLAANAVEADVVLLIDEAENHLHIDAQADLVTMLHEQRQASKVIYTTHSPACLPFDLGRSVRAVLPSDTLAQTSRISNAFWTEGKAGFSPLLLAMGAGAAAFSVARKVVLAEGATEMILLPTLLRESSSRTELDFQVAPGLSQTPPSAYGNLDFEGARVAYLVDGDGGGSTLRTSLQKAGVPEDRIVTLPALTLEDLVEKRTYISTVTTLVKEAAGAHPAEPLTIVDDEPRDRQVTSWAAAQGVARPSKVVIANALVESGISLVNPQKLNELVELLGKLEAALSGHQD